jgi:hypothetical protein
MGERISLRESLSRKTEYATFGEWVVGDTPLITHAWSEKAKQEMLAKHVKATKPGREVRDPDSDFVNSLYPMGTDAQGKKFYGFPATGLKKAIYSVAHKDKGIPKTDVAASLWLDAAMIRVPPAKAGAICDLPLVRIWGSEPEMREDMVRIGTVTKTAQLAYRAQFQFWAIRLRGRFNRSKLSAESLAFLTNESGMGCGIGEWRNEKLGIFGAYHLANAEEAEAWEAFARGRGPLPESAAYIYEDEFAEAAE